MSTSIAVAHGSTAINARIEAQNWEGVEQSLDEFGCARIERLLTAHECEVLRQLYVDETAFRSRIVMSRHNFGRGEYKYFRYPLPEIVQGLRMSAFPKLAPIANRWNRRMKKSVQFPSDHEQFLHTCHAEGQTRPTPLMLRYVAGDYNCLHQDVYGEHLFPLQIAILLCRPNEDFAGGEFVLTEQRPRMQSRVDVVQLQQGDAVVFAVRERPVAGARGDYRVNMRHGVSRLCTGERYTLGIIFHDAQ
jgi:hypothetical protein